MSTKPGVTNRPLASISSLPVPATVPTTAILPSFNATSASRVPEPVPSATVPPRTTTSNSAIYHSRVGGSVTPPRGHATPVAHSSPIHKGREASPPMINVLIKCKVRGDTMADTGTAYETKPSTYIAALTEV